MNNTLQQALVEILQKTTAGIAQGIDFLSTQLPDVVRQLLVYHMVRDIVYCIVAFIPVVILAVLGVYLWKWALNTHDYTRDDRCFLSGIATMCGLVAIAFLLAGLLNFTVDAMEIWLAPKVWLIEYAATLVQR